MGNVMPDATSGNNQWFGFSKDIAVFALGILASIIGWLLLQSHDSWQDNRRMLDEPQVKLLEEIQSNYLQVYRQLSSNENPGLIYDKLTAAKNSIDEYALFSNEGGHVDCLRRNHDLTPLTVQPVNGTPIPSRENMKVRIVNARAILREYYVESGVLHPLWAMVHRIDSFAPADCGNQRSQPPVAPGPPG